MSQYFPGASAMRIGHTLQHHRCRIHLMANLNCTNSYHTNSNCPPATAAKVKSAKQPRPKAQGPRPRIAFFVVRSSFDPFLAMVCAESETVRRHPTSIHEIASLQEPTLKIGRTFHLNPAFYTNATMWHIEPPDCPALTRAVSPDPRRTLRRRACRLVRLGWWAAECLRPVLRYRPHPSGMRTRSCA